MSLNLTDPPALPSLSDPATFNARAIALFNWIRDTFIPELEALTTADLLQLLPAGSALLPGLAFQVDPDTGVYRPGANQLGISTGGTRRVLLDSTAMQVDVPITGTAAQSSLNDVTSGKLMKVGAFGVGGNPIGMSGSASIGSRDLATGAHSFGIGQPDGPETLAYAYCTWVLKNFTSRRHFLAFRDGSTQPDLFAWIGHQQEADGSIIWHKLVSLQTGVVGSVAQSGGVPTGAIIEKGSNANGSYTKFADGTMICRYNGNSSDSVEVTWTYPAAFAATPSVSLSVNAGSARTSYLSSRGTSSVNFSVYTAAGARAANPVDLIAIGNWF